MMIEQKKPSVRTAAPAHGSAGWDSGAEFPTAHDHDADPWHAADEAPAASFAGGADDALGLYLKQMGAIPLLSRAEELALAERLERARTRYRRAVLFNWFCLHRVPDLFRRAQEDGLPIDPDIDVI